MGEIINIDPMEKEKSAKEDLIGKYTGKPFNPLKPPGIKEGSEEKGEYRALTENTRPGRTVRFRIIDAKGISYGSGYAHLLGWLFTPPDLLVLQTTTHIFTIEGRGLEEIERALMDEKMRELREFNPQTYLLADDEKIVIERLDVISRFDAQV